VAEAVVAQYKVPTHDMLGQTEENHEQLYSSQGSG